MRTQIRITLPDDEVAFEERDDAIRFLLAERHDVEQRIETSAALYGSRTRRAAKLLRQLDEIDAQLFELRG